MLSKLSQKNYFCPQTLQIILGQSLNSFSIQFWYKNIFFIFFVSSLRKEREKMSNSNNKENN